MERSIKNVILALILVILVNGAFFYVETLVTGISRKVVIGMHIFFGILQVILFLKLFLFDSKHKR